MVTADNPEGSVSAAEPAGETGIKPGIYLEEKKSTIGTAGTAKATEYRTFWVTLTLAEHSAVMVVLDDDFKPTGIKDTFTQDILQGPGWHFIADGEKRYQRLRPLLDRMLAPPPKPAAATAAKSAAANWWGGGDASGAAKKDLFNLDKAKKPAAKAGPKKGGWWDN